MRAGKDADVAFFLLESDRKKRKEKPPIVVAHFFCFFLLLFIYRKINSKISGGRLLLLGRQDSALEAYIIIK